MIKTEHPSILKEFEQSLIRDYAEIKEYSVSTITSYQETIEPMLKWICKKKKIPDKELKVRDIKTDDIINYRVYLSRDHRNNRTGNKLSRSSIGTYIPAINKFCEVFKIKSKLDSKFRAVHTNTIYLKFKIPNKGQVMRELIPLSSEELQLVFEESMKTRNGKRDYAIMRIAYDCALRRSEVIGLNDEDVFRETRVVDGVERDLPYARIGNLDFIPKDNSDGKIQLDEITWNAIQEYRKIRNPYTKITNIDLKFKFKEEEIAEAKQRLKEARDKGQEWKVKELQNKIKVLYVQRNRLENKIKIINDSNKAMFLSSQRKRLSDSNVDIIYKDIGIRTKIIKKKMFSSHIMRKSRATDLYKQGWLLDEVKKVTRHSTIKALQRYIHSTIDEVNGKLYHSYQNNKTEQIAQPKLQTKPTNNKYETIKRLYDDGIITKTEMLQKLGV